MMLEAFTGFWFWFREVSEFTGVLVMQSFGSGDPMKFIGCWDGILLALCATSLWPAVGTGSLSVPAGVLASIMDIELSIPLVEAV